MSLVGILKKTGWKSSQDLTSHSARRRKERSEYSDQALAQHYENYREIIENIKTRPRLPLPPVSRRNITWSEANLQRAASFDHLDTRRCSNLLAKEQIIRYSLRQKY